jgi:predicted transcriptional regulator
MIVELDRETGDRIQQEVVAGRFSNPQELISVAVRHYLRDCDGDAEFTREEAQAAINEGLRDIAEGRVIDEAEVRRHFQEMRTEWLRSQNARL